MMRWVDWSRLIDPHPGDPGDQKFHLALEALRYFAPQWSAA